MGLSPQLTPLGAWELHGARGRVGGLAWGGGFQPFPGPAPGLQCHTPGADHAWLRPSEGLPAPRVLRPSSPASAW